MLAFILDSYKVAARKAIKAQQSNTLTSPNEDLPKERSQRKRRIPRKLLSESESECDVESSDDSLHYPSEPSEKIKKGYIIMR